MKNNNIKPTGLKGKESISRMIQLMGPSAINESSSRSEIILTKKGPDGKNYAIVKENHDYFIKVANKIENPKTDDFQYIGGLQNKRDKVYESYAKAIKQLNLSFISLAEAEGQSSDINIFENDDLTEEEVVQEEAACGIVRGAGHDKHIMELDADKEDEAELSEDEEAIERMLGGEAEDLKEHTCGRMKIGNAIKVMDDAISEATNERVSNLLETLESFSEKEQLALLEGLKKKI